MKVLAALFLALSMGAAQDGSAEEQDLSRAIAEAGSSPVEFVRAVEKHLLKYPQSTHKEELERALVKAAIEVKDEKRVVEYGERVLARDPDDVQLLDKVTRSLLATDAKETSARALKYARRYGELVATLRKQDPPARMGRGQWREEVDRGVGHNL